MKVENGKKGFTLIELIVVVVVLAILAAVAVPMVSGWVKTAEENAAKANARTIEVALKAYMAEESKEELNTTNHVDAIAALARYGVGKKGKNPHEDYTGYVIEGSKRDYIYSTLGAVRTTQVNKGSGQILIKLSGETVPLP